MNKLIFKSLVVILLAVILLFLFWPKKTVEQPLSHPNVVSFEGDSTTADNNLQIKKPVTTKQEPVSETDIATIENNEVEPNRELSYLDKYRILRKFTTCESVIYRVANSPKENPALVFTERFKHLDIIPTPQQLKAIDRHVTQCKKLMNTILSLHLAKSKDDEDSQYFHVIKTQLENHLRQLKPVTDKEKRIAEVIKTKPKWQKHFQEVIAASTGDETKNAEEIANLNEQISTLNQRQRDIFNLLKETDDKAPLQSELRNVWHEINDLRVRIKELRLVDPELRNQKMLEFSVVNDRMFEFLKSKDPDVFYEAQMTLEKANHIQFIGHYPYKDIGKNKAKLPFIEYVSPGDVVMQVAGIQNIELFGLVVHHATQLYLCELGADCGPDSEWIQVYCFIGYNKIYPESCDMDVEYFYQSHLFNENQWHDVMLVFDILRELYES